MPVILRPEKMESVTSGDGWKKITLADQHSIGTSAIAAQRWIFSPFTTGPELEHAGTDEMLYVISGSGILRVNGASLALERETVVWLEHGDIYQFSTAENSLEVLHSSAPGE